MTLKAYGDYPQLCGVRAIDNEYADTCTIVGVWRASGDHSIVVVYDDEPDVPVSLGDYEGRFTLIDKENT